MKVLVLGSGGMLGHLTTVYLKEQGHAVSDLSYPDKAFESSIVMDITDLKRFEEYLDSNNFDMIINCIALLIKASNDNKAGAVYINSYFPHWLEKKYNATHTKIIQVSTDGVFGEGKPPFKETDSIMCTSFYARSKSLGELINNKDLTVRSSYFGPDRNKNGQGLLNWFFSQKGTVSGYKKVVFTGVTSLEFAKFVDEYGMTATGVYNLGAIKSVSKYYLLQTIKEKFSLDDIEIVPQDNVISDTSVTTERNDIKYRKKSYEAMINELYDFIENHKDMYCHYTFL